LFWPPVYAALAHCAQFGIKPDVSQYILLIKKIAAWNITPKQLQKDNMQSKSIIFACISGKTTEHHGKSILEDIRL